MILASPTPLDQEASNHASLNARMDQNGKNTRSQPTLHSKELVPSNKKSTPTDQSKLDSPSITISCHTNQESTPTSQDLPSEDMLLSLSDGESKTVLNTGLPKTHGEHHGENKDTSESKPDNADLTQMPMPEPQAFKCLVI